MSDKEYEEYVKKLDNNKKIASDTFLNKKCPVCIFLQMSLFSGIGFFIQCFIINKRKELLQNSKHKAIILTFIFASAFPYYYFAYNKLFMLIHYKD